MNNMMKVQIGATDAIKAASKALKAIYHNGKDEIITSHLDEAKCSIVAALRAMTGDDIVPDETGGVANCEVHVHLEKEQMAEDSITEEEVKADKIEAITQTIRDGELTIDDWKKVYQVEINLVERRLREEYGIDLYGDDIDNKDAEDVIDDETKKVIERIENAEDKISVEDYTEEDKTKIYDAIRKGKTVRRAARTLNRHIDKGDFKPNREKLRKVNGGLIDDLNSLKDYFLKRELHKEIIFIEHIIARAKTIRHFRHHDEFKTRIGTVLRFRPILDFSKTRGITMSPPQD